ncbi:hypothetical protein EV283_2667 [Sphingomonas sp. BK036]|nr:hypothetical protein EV283_2667 [Sphingomonas sp. BK036]
MPVRDHRPPTWPVELPGETATLVDMARAIAAHAGPVLSPSGSTLLTLSATTPAGVDPGRIDLACWDGRTPVSAPWCSLAIGGGNCDPALAALEQSGKVLLAGLLPRWPANARPPSIGIVTDGHGVAFSPDHPSPGSAGWLGWQLGGACAVTTLLPFAPTSRWARLTAPDDQNTLNGLLLFNRH